MAMMIMVTKKIEDDNGELVDETFFVNKHKIIFIKDDGGVDHWAKSTLTMDNQERPIQVFETKENVVALIEAN